MDKIDDIMKVINKIYRDKLPLLYENPSSTLIIYRILPFYTRQILLKLILINKDNSLTDKLIDEDILCSYSNKTQIEKYYFNILVPFKIVKETKEANNEKTYHLNLNFKLNLIKALSSGFENLSLFFVNTNEKIESFKKSLVKGKQMLDKYLEQIISLENFQVLDVENSSIKFLISKGLIRKDSGRYRLTGICFSLLLENRQFQLRGIFIRYLDFLNSESNENCIKIIKLVFEFVCLEVGVAYNLNDSLIQDSKVMESIENFHWMGVIRLNKKKKFFYVTPLFNNIFEANVKMTIQEKHFYIETNFRMYVYGNMNNIKESKETKVSSENMNQSQEQILIFKMLLFFIEIRHELDGFYICDITRNKIREAFKRGINSSQIIKFLCNYSKNGVPSNVEQQIRIWEIEKNAILYEKVNFYYEFNSNEGFISFIDLCKGKKIPLLWKSDENMSVCIQKKFEEEIGKILSRIS